MVKSAIGFEMISNGSEDLSTGVSRRVAVCAENLLQERFISESGQIACEYHDGTLIMRGRVSSYYEKQLAQEAVRTLEGVEQIVNRIEVVTTS